MNSPGTLDYYTENRLFPIWSVEDQYMLEIVFDGHYWDEDSSEWLPLPNWKELCDIPRIIQPRALSTT